MLKFQYGTYIYFYYYRYNLYSPVKKIYIPEQKWPGMLQIKKPIFYKIKAKKINWLQAKRVWLNYNWASPVGSVKRKKKF